MKTSAQFSPRYLIHDKSNILYLLTYVDIYETLARELPKTCNSQKEKKQLSLQSAKCMHMIGMLEIKINGIKLNLYLSNLIAL